jgi:putative flippase GtrA
LKDEAFRFLQATVISAGCSLLLPIALHEGFGVPQRIAVAVGLLLVFALNFVTTRLYVFRSRGAPGGEMFRFALVSLAFRGGEYLAFLLLNVLFGMQYVLALMLVLGVSWCSKFLTYRQFVYRLGPLR